MDKLRIVGGRRLSGSVRVSGAKNAALPEMAATLLTEEPVTLSNVPDVWDVGTMRRLLLCLGAHANQSSLSEITLTTRRLVSHEAPYRLVKTMRASVLALGPLLARHGRARVSLPGGCAIGARPIDQHVLGLQQLGAEIDLRHGFVEARADKLRGARIRFEQPTVGGTENLLMASTLARGETVLEGCAREPEIEDLAKLLTTMGARIEGAGTDRIQVQGVDSLHGGSHDVQPDRVEAATYLVAGALLGNDVRVEGLRPEHLTALTESISRAGVMIETSASALRVTAPGAGLRPLEIETAPYPGFATDMQAQLMVLLTQAGGTSRLRETIFENRFMHVAELARMGARIELSGNEARVHGPTPLSGAEVMATDLRASACLVLAGLVATGETTIDRVYHLDRGYEHIEEKMNQLGADVTRIV